uniref:Sulfate_transp domain-containing protein n=1 Tax=Loa loa TaxID=7209 RepID=A0A1I7VJG8_LOALO
MYSSDAANLKRKMTKYVKNVKELMKEEATQSQKSQIKNSREPEMSTAIQKSEMQLTLNTERKPAINQEQFDKKHGYRRSRLPIICWLLTYDWHEDLLQDIINGIMISIIYIPQGLAYGLMVGIPPIYGIYTGIVGPLVYIFLGTSRHASTGAFAIISMMVGSVIEQTLTESKLTYNETDRLCCSEITQKPDPEKAIQLSSLIAFFVGIIQVVLGLLNAGLLAVWLSDQLVEGLTSGAAVHVLASQLQTMTGVRNVPHTSEMFGIVRVIFSISLCYFATDTPFDLHLHIVGDVDAGMRAPFFPDFGETGKIIFSAFSIAIVSFVIHIALAKLIAKEYKYQINVNQEWLALGTMHIVASFFGCFAGGSSLSRTITSGKIGVKVT